MQEQPTAQLRFIERIDTTGINKIRILQQKIELQDDKTGKISHRWQDVPLEKAIP